MAVPKGTRVGGRQKGVPNKATRDIRAAAQLHAAAALKEIVRLSREAENEQTRLAACREIMDRAYGKAPQAHTGEGGQGPVLHSIEITIVDPA